MSDTPAETLLEFPCEFPIKVFGLASDDFQPGVVAIVQRHAQLAPGDAIQRRQSQGGKYDAVTITITATSKAQIDVIYQDLTASPTVVMAL